MPIAQRGAQDDCQKFTIGATTARGNANTNTGTGTAKAAAISAAAAKKGGKGRRMAGLLIANYEW
jgi:hypothetical protein